MTKKVFILASFLILAVGCRELGSERLVKFQDSPFSTIVLTDAEFDKKSGQRPVNLDWHNANYLTIGGTSFYFSPFVLDIQKLSVIQVVRKDTSTIPFRYSKISPDGKYIAYGVEGDEIEISRLSDLFASGYLLPDHHVDAKLQMEWSRDSQQLAIIQFGRDNNNVFLQIYNLSDRSLKKIFEYSEDTRNTNIGSEEGFSWSFDNKRLAFALRYEPRTEDSNAKTQSDLFIYNIEENTLTRVTSTPDFSEKYPSWHPKSDVLMFVSVPEKGYVGQIDGRLSFSANDGACVKLLPGFEGISFPSWSPDGSQIAYLSSEGIEMLDVKGIIPPEYLSPDTLCQINQ